MTQKKKRKLSRGKLTLIVLTGIALFVIISLFIANFFFPVKYLRSYLVGGSPNEAGQLRVSFLDVGNGDCTIIELPNGKTMLIDGGDGEYSNSLKILSELNGRKISKIDYLICSSVENGACGGLAEILKYKTVDKVFAPCCSVTYVSDGFKSFCSELNKFDGEIFCCEYGVAVSENEDFSFCFLSPDSHLYEGSEYGALASNPTEENIKNSSAVIWLECCGVNFLFLGNTGQAVQKKLMEYYQTTGLEYGGKAVDITACNILKMSDHGSTEGAYAPFLDLINPDSAIISVGANGRGCPTLAALANAQNCVGSNLYRTDELGTVTVTVKEGNYEISKEKK